MIEETVQIIVGRAAVLAGEALRFVEAGPADGRDLDARNAERRPRVGIADIARAEDANLHERRRILILRNHT